MAFLVKTIALPYSLPLQEIGVRDANDARARFFFDATFFIIITTIGLNIVFGIIVDTFSELRDEKVSTFTHKVFPAN